MRQKNGAVRENPFLRQAEPEKTQSLGEDLGLEVDPVIGEAVSRRGPSRPLHAPGASPAAPSRGTPVTVLGLHGGAGTSTVVQLLRPVAGDQVVVDGGHWDPTGLGQSQMVVAVARTHAHGLAQAELFAKAWSSALVEDVTVLGLVLVDDAPRLPKPLRHKARLVAGMLAHTWRLPWVEPWRLLPDVSEIFDDAPTRARRTAKHIVRVAAAQIQ